MFPQTKLGLVSEDECTSILRRGLRVHVGAVESAVAVKSVSGCRMRRFEEEVMLIVESDFLTPEKKKVAQKTVPSVQREAPFAQKIAPATQKIVPSIQSKAPAQSPAGYMQDPCTRCIVDFIVENHTGVRHEKVRADLSVSDEKLTRT